jgi:trimethylguanosine synthase
VPHPKGLNYERGDFGEDFVPTNLRSFYKEKNYFFSRYSWGVQIDEDAHQTVTPEPIAYFIALYASQIPDALVVDAACGVGGNLLAFAALKNVTKVVGVDTSTVKIAYVNFNAEIYNLDTKVVTINEDVKDAGILAVLGLC